MNNKQLVDKLLALYVDKVSIHFSGSGDSGEREQVLVEPEINLPQELISEIENIESSMNDSMGLDWWNNDGGFGDFHIDTKTKMAHMSITCNYTEDGYGKGIIPIENSEELQEAFENGVEVITGEFSGEGGSEIGEFTCTPDTNVISINDNQLGDIISGNIDAVKIKEPKHANYATEYYNGDFVIKLADKKSKITIKANQDFECEGQSESDELDLDSKEE